MLHHGNLVRAAMRAKGLNIKLLSEKLGQHRVTVERDLKAEKLTKKVIDKYVATLDMKPGSFYSDSKPVSIMHEKTAPAGAETVSVDVLRDELIRAKDETINEQRKHIETLTRLVRFFPNAVQQPTITA